MTTKTGMVAPADGVRWAVAAAGVTPTVTVPAQVDGTRVGVVRSSGMVTGGTGVSTL